MRHTIALAMLLMGLFMSTVGHARTLCMIVLDQESHEIVHQQGDCDERVTPASTFKLALALMAYDAGVLQDAMSPVLPYRAGHADWGGDAWRQPTDPAHWMRHSVVWFSRQITPLLGVERLSTYAAAFGYGNADFSGDVGQSNALERAWMTSSLKISPREQVVFLSRMLSYELPVSRGAVDTTREITPLEDTPAGWRVWGKTGTAYPREASGSFDYDRGWGWFVGWAERDGTTLVFAHLLQDEGGQAASPGARARAQTLAGFDNLVSRLSQ